ncbi:hypothetical protein C0995_007143, partial [Termitomyces sp. Mi166
TFAPSASSPCRPEAATYESRPPPLPPPCPLPLAYWAKAGGGDCYAAPPPPPKG